MLSALCFFFLSSAQAQRLDQVVNDNVEILHDQHIDSVLSLVTTDSAILFYQRNNKPVIKKLLAAQGKVTIFPEMHLTDDSLFDWFRTNVNALKDEDIHPFIWQSIRRGTVVYEHRKPPLQSPVSSIGFYGQEGFSVSLMLADCEQHAYNAPDAPVNLNYAYNVNTRLYQFYTRLKKDAEIISLPGGSLSAVSR